MVRDDRGGEPREKQGASEEAFVVIQVRNSGGLNESSSSGSGRKCGLGSIWEAETIGLWGPAG